MTFEEVAPEFTRDAGLDAEGKRAVLEWMKRTAPARAEVARMLRQAGAKR